MKRIILAAIISLLTINVMAQCDPVPHVTTMNINYNWTNYGDEGISIEMGLTGSESKISGHFGIAAYQRTVDAIKGNLDSTYVAAAVYAKGSYRFIRVPYKLSVYASAYMFMDLERSMYPAAGLKFLVPTYRLAFSVEPIVNKYGLHIQGGVNIPLQ